MGNARDAYLDFIYTKNRDTTLTLCDVRVSGISYSNYLWSPRRNFVYTRVEIMMMAFTSYCGVVLWEKQGRRRRTPGDDCEQAVKVLQVLACMCNVRLSVCMREFTTFGPRRCSRHAGKREFGCQCALQTNAYIQIKSADYLIKTLLNTDAVRA